MTDYDTIGTSSTGPPVYRERAVRPAEATLLPLGDAERELLDIAAEAARTLFHANAASVLILDPDPRELVFAAVAGASAEKLRGRRIPASLGIAGRVLETREPTAVGDLAGDARFAREVAEASGYVPRELMAAPILRGERVFGVVEVLDRPQFSRFSAVELDMLVQLARQLGVTLALLQPGPDADATRLRRIAAALQQADGERRRAAEPLIAELERVLTG
jgi:GAF domain-containing protein